MAFAHNNFSQDTVPWYRIPFVWLLIAIPLSAVIAGFVTLQLAMSSDDGLVVDDYYWQGKQINRILARDRAAAQYQLAGVLKINRRRDILRMRLNASPSVKLPARMHLKLLHATRAGFDQTVELIRTPDGHYHGLWPELVPGHWYLQLEANDWRLVGSMRAPKETQIRLDPAEYCV